jgi:DNA-binding NarL/FixJ family response regulator
MKEPRVEKRAVLVDPHPLWLEAVEQVLDRVGVQVVKKTTSLQRALEAIDELAPDMVIAEISPAEDGAAGLQWLRDLSRLHPDVRTVVLSTSDEPGVIRSALEGGAVAYVVKKAQPEDLAVAVRQAYDHSIFLPGAVSVEKEPSPGHPQPAAELTKREVEILRLASEGHSNAELARILWVTEQTVKFHLSNIYRKLDVANRTEASRWAQVHGLLTPQPYAVEAS